MGVQGFRMWFIGAAVLAAFAGSGCARRSAVELPHRAAASNPEKTSAGSTVGHHVPSGRDKVAAGDRDALDRRFESWGLVRQKPVGQCRALWIQIGDFEDREFRLVVLDRGSRIVLNLEANSSDWLHFEGQCDIDGDGAKEALFSVYSGGAHCCTTCCYVSTGRNARQLGGFEAEHGDCGEPGDRNHDGRTEFIAGDYCLAYFENSFAESPSLSFAYGYRKGRFVDLSTELLADEYRTQIEDSRRTLKTAPPDEVDYPYVRNRATLWYVHACFLGQERQALKEIKATLPPKAWSYFASMLDDRRELAQSRKDLLWTGPRKDLL